MSSNEERYAKAFGVPIKKAVQYRNKEESTADSISDNKLETPITKLAREHQGITRDLPRNDSGVPRYGEIFSGNYQGKNLNRKVQGLPEYYRKIKLGEKKESYGTGDEIDRKDSVSTNRDKPTSNTFFSRSSNEPLEEHNKRLIDRYSPIDLSGSSFGLGDNKIFNRLGAVSNPLAREKIVSGMSEKLSPDKDTGELVSPKMFGEKFIENTSGSSDKEGLYSGNIHLGNIAGKTERDPRGSVWTSKETEPKFNSPYKRLSNNENVRAQGDQERQQRESSINNAFTLGQMNPVQAAMYKRQQQRAQATPNQTSRASSFGMTEPYNGNSYLDADLYNTGQLLGLRERQANRSGWTGNLANLLDTFLTHSQLGRATGQNVQAGGFAYKPFFTDSNVVTL